VTQVSRRTSGRDKAGHFDDARMAAFEVLSRVASRGSYANLLLAAVLRERRLPRQDAALVTELVYGTLRGRGTYDAVISRCADRDLDLIDPPVRDVLRLGVHQLLGMQVKPHAAVDTTVSVAVAVAGRRPAGFVNAVLRRVATLDLDSWIGIVAPDRAADLVGHLSIRYSHPRWIVTAIAEALGEASSGGLSETEAALAADLRRPVVTLAAVPGLASADELVAAGAVPARWSPFGAYLPDGDPGVIAAVQERRTGVQDEASQLAALALARADCADPEGRRPGAPGGADPAGRWLDLCAGPGGKARMLAGLAADRGAVLLAADGREHRARLAGKAVEVVEVARAVTADGTAPAWRPGTFDRVLADVPCSGLGSLRRRPEIRWRRSPEDIVGLAELQAGLLTAALESAAPGGIVAYVTCSPHVGETRSVLDAALKRCANVRVLDAPAILSEVPDLRCPEPFERYAQFWPHRHGTDAIFIALLAVRR
jgi:16S rRNA (cytosine967-C5)-methyltransferase